MDRKRILCILFALLMVITAVACGTPTGNKEATGSLDADSSQGAEESQEEVQPEPSPTEEEEPETETLPAVPDLEDYPKTELPFDPMGLWSQRLEPEYTATPADSGFLAALAGLSEEDFTQVRNSENFFEIGGYVLYNTMDSPMGPSKVIVQSPSGETETLLDSSVAVFSMALMDRESVCVELVEWLHFEGHSGLYYRFDLTTGVLEPLPAGETVSGYTTSHYYHSGNHYSTLQAQETTEMGEASDVFILQEDGEYHTFVEDVGSYTFSGDYFYYTDRDRMELYRVDLNGRNRILLKTFDEMVYSISVAHNRLLFSDSTRSYLEDLNTREAISLPEGMRSFHIYPQGYYFVTEDFILMYAPYDGGEAEKLLANFTGNLSAVVGDEVFFYTFWSVDINRYDYWKIALDGSGFTPLGRDSV